MKIVCRYTFEDYVEAHRLHRSRSLWRQWDRAIAFVFLCLTAGVGLLIVLKHPAQYRIALPSFGLAVFWALLLFVFPRLRMQYLFKRSPYLNQELTFEISDEGILQESPTMRSQRNWSMFTGWADNKRMFMIYSSPIQFILFPKRFFAPGQADQLRELLGRKLSNK